MRKFTIIRLFFFVALFGVLSCKKEENFTSRINFFNAVINAPSPLSLRIDSLLLMQNVGYDSLKANIITPSGTFAVNLTGNGQSLLKFTTNLQSNESYTAVVYDSAQKFRFFMRKDVFPTTPGFGRCAVRIYTLIPDALNLFLAKDTSKLIITGKSFNDFGNATTSPVFQEIDTINTPKIFRSDSVLVASVPAAFRSGKIYSVYITGSIKDSARLHPKCIVQLHN